MVTALDGRQMRWKCRRGMLELDYLLLNFFDQCYESLPTDQKILFDLLLASPDVELYQWLVQKVGIQGLPFESLIGRILSASQDR